MLIKCTTQVLAFAAMGAISTQASATLVGHWEFENAGDLGAATVGSDLVLTGTDAAVAGAGGSDTGATQVGVSSHYTMTHGIAANGGGALVNQYTLLFDISYPAASFGTWRALFSAETDISTDDGEYFIHPADETWGVSALTYTDNATTGVFASSADTWYRAVLSVDLGNAVSLYINGTLAGTHNASSVDSRFALNAVTHILGDNDGDDGLINLSNLAIYDTALTANEAAALGAAVPEPGSLALLGLGGLALLRRRRA